MSASTQQNTAIQTVLNLFGGKVLADETGAFRAGFPGIAFKNGRAYLFRDDSVTVLNPPHDLRAWTKTAERPWWFSSRNMADTAIHYCDALPYLPHRVIEEYDWVHSTSEVAAEMHGQDFILPSGQLAWPFYYTYPWQVRDYCNAQAYLAQFPARYIQAIRQFPDRRWQALVVLMRCPGSYDLFKSNPALFFALANNWVFHKPAVKRPLAAIRRLLPKSQKKILAWLGFPATNSVRKIFKRLVPKSVTVENLLYLRNSLADPTCLQWLQHCPRINHGVLRLVNDARYHPMLSPVLLKELGFDEDNDHPEVVIHTVRDIIRMANWQDESLRLPFRSLQAMKDFHDQLTAQHHARMLIDPAVCDAQWPEAPYAGTRAIQPIRGYADLETEGKEQKNCAATYVHDILAGKVFLYRVEGAVRATLSVRKELDGTWKRDQLLAARNRPIPDMFMEQIWSELFTSRPPARVAC